MVSSLKAWRDKFLKCTSWKLRKCFESGKLMFTKQTQSDGTILFKSKKATHKKVKGKKYKGMLQVFTSEDMFWAFFAPSESKACHEQMFSKVIAPGTLVWVDGHPSYISYRDLYDMGRVIHKVEFVSAEGVHINKAEGRNNLIKMPTRGPLFGFTTNPECLPLQFDFQMFNSNIALHDFPGKDSYLRKRQTCMNVLLSISEVYQPGYRMNENLDEIWKAKTVCCEFFKGPWTVQDWKRRFQNMKRAKVNTDRSKVVSRSLVIKS